MTKGEKQAPLVFHAIFRDHGSTEVQDTLHLLWQITGKEVKEILQLRYRDQPKKKSQIYCSTVMAHKFITRKEVQNKLQRSHGK